MRKLFIVLTLMLASCEWPDTHSVQAEDTITVDGNDIAIRTITYKGHDYILFTGFYKGSLCHSESCHCKTLSKSE